MGPKSNATTNMGMIWSEISDRNTRGNNATGNINNNAPILAATGIVAQFGSTMTWSDILGQIKAKVQNATYSVGNLTNTASSVGNVVRIINISFNMLIIYRLKKALLL